MASPPGKTSPLASPVPAGQRSFMDSPEIVVVTTRKVACDGVGGALFDPSSPAEIREAAAACAGLRRQEPLDAFAQGGFRIRAQRLV